MVSSYCIIIIITLLLSTIQSIKHHHQHHHHHQQQHMTSTIKHYINQVSKSIIILNAVITFSSTQTLADTTNPIDIDLNRVKLIRETENFLTNPVLEAFRKLDQLESDETIGLNGQKAILLYPIIDISKDIENIKMKLEYIQHETNDDKILTTLSDINSILSSSKYNAKEFKKIFNRYSDNIFYADPRRANLYLGGGAIPDSSQTNKYLYRNVALTSIQNLKEDIDTLIKEKQWSDKQAVDDTIDDIREALDAFKNYFDLIDPNDIKVSLDIYKSSHK
jgi:hypothetical protein